MRHEEQKTDILFIIEADNAEKQNYHTIISMLTRVGSWRRVIK
jgi:hypothetical protein